MATTRHPRLFREARILRRVTLVLNTATLLVTLATLATLAPAYSPAPAPPAPPAPRAPTTPAPVGVVTVVDTSTGAVERFPAYVDPGGTVGVIVVPMGTP